MMCRTLLKRIKCNGIELTHQSSYQIVTRFRGMMTDQGEIRSRLLLPLFVLHSGNQEATAK